jgi:hypothetical protein
MRGLRRLMVLLTVAAFVVAPVVVWAASQTDWPVGKGATLDYRSVEGAVIAVDLNSRTIQVTATEGSATRPVSVAFTDRTIGHQRIVRTRPTDLKVGEHVAMLYSGSGERSEGFRRGRATPRQRHEEFSQLMEPAPILGLRPA